MLKLEKSKVKIEIYGTVYEVTRPSVKQLEGVYSELETAEAKDARKVWCDFLVPLGFSQEALDDLEPEHYVQVLEAMTGTKKKSLGT